MRKEIDLSYIHDENVILKLFCKKNIITILFKKKKTLKK